MVSSWERRTNTTVKANRLPRTEPVTKGDTSRKVPVGSRSASVIREPASTIRPMPHTTERTRKVWRPIGTSCSSS